MQDAVKALCHRLGSKTNTDILETIDFFVSANEFGLANADEGIRNMLALIWSRDATVKEAVVNAYKKLYIEKRADNHRLTMFSCSVCTGCHTCHFISSFLTAFHIPRSVSILSLHDVSLLFR